MKKTIFKQISMALALTLAATTVAFAAAVPQDVSGSPYEKAITTLVESDAITGDSDGLFHPGDNLTRAQACVILVKTIAPSAIYVSGSATQSPPNSGFYDMKGYSWAENYIGYAVKAGIVDGYPDGTFKPGNKVSTEEMMAMVLRGTGLTSAQIGTNWPEDYIAKAESEGVMKDVEAPYPKQATKGVAAQMTYNKLAELKAAAPVTPDQPQGTDKDQVKDIPDASGMTFATASFDASMSTFGGKDISSKAQIYTFGKKADYKKDMTFNKKISDYRLDTVYKYKNVNTPAWYLEENGKIISMILPADVGFSGTVYCVINGTVGTLNGLGEPVTGIETLTATRELTWLGKKSLTGIPTKDAEYNDGQLFELYAANGQITNVGTTASHKGKMFTELSKAVSGSTWDKVTGFADGVATLSSGLAEIKDNASVYVLENGQYKSGSRSAIKANSEVRLYDVSDDTYTAADIVIVKQ